MSEDKVKRERNFKLCINLSIRSEIERSSETKRPIAKIANPVPNEKDEHANQYTHATEGVSSELRKMKGNKAKIVNNTTSEIDSCGLSQVAEDSMIDEQLSNVLGKELSNCSYSNVRKMIQEGKL